MSKPGSVGNLEDGWQLAQRSDDEVGLLIDRAIHRTFTTVEQHRHRTHSVGTYDIVGIVAYVDQLCRLYAEPRRRQLEGFEG